MSFTFRESGLHADMLSTLGGGILSFKEKAGKANS